ncbi:sulfite exporter TauE/SafE family protein [Pseudonocardia nigra]|uniref:sulfite exporter TauE/SafE family protein n=1 Tax=Pseudonocardia nigra TaxID=1921578 RepID=UPI001C60202D|nr:sulfite exporter TauE/SafE family protein [Pseudonocardia nigra]
MAIVLAGLVVALGALVQGTVGFGISLISAPFLAMVDPALVPVPLLLLTTGHALLALYRERGDTDWTGVGWALLGRLPGTALGVLAVVALPPRWFAAVVAVTVLVCAGLSLLRWRPRPTVPALLVAGVVSGAGGAASAIGGPPVALLYQNEGGPRVRATLAAYFVAGAAVSLAGLALAGEVDGDAMGTAALMVPFMIAGFAVSSPARRLLDRGWTRPAVIALAATGAVALLVQVVVG